MSVRLSSMRSCHVLMSGLLRPVLVCAKGMYKRFLGSRTIFNNMKNANNTITYIYVSYTHSYIKLICLSIRMVLRWIISKMDFEIIMSSTPIYSIPFHFNPFCSNPIQSNPFHSCFTQCLMETVVFNYYQAERYQLSIKQSFLFKVALCNAMHVQRNDTCPAVIPRIFACVKQVLIDWKLFFGYKVQRQQIHGTVERFSTNQDARRHPVSCVLTG